MNQEYGFECENVAPRAGAVANLVTWCETHCLIVIGRGSEEKQGALCKALVFLLPILSDFFSYLLLYSPLNYKDQWSVKR